MSLERHHRHGIPVGSSDRRTTNRERRTRSCIVGEGRIPQLVWSRREWQLWRGLELERELVQPGGEVKGIQALRVVRPTVVRPTVVRLTVVRPMFVVRATVVQDPKLAERSMENLAKVQHWQRPTKHKERKPETEKSNNYSTNSPRVFTRTYFEQHFDRR